MKDWLLERFLPMWAKETVLRENRQLMARNRAITEENARLRSYIRGIRLGLRRRIKEEHHEAI